MKCADDPPIRRKLIEDFQCFVCSVSNELNSSLTKVLSGFIENLQCPVFSRTNNEYFGSTSFDRGLYILNEKRMSPPPPP